jgi:transposase-like protein
MSKRIFTKEQIILISENTNVASCSERYIEYRKEFKISAIKQYYEHNLTPSEIFRLAGFDIKLIGRDIPQKCLERWKKTFKLKGEKGLSINTKSRKKKISEDISDRDKIERLEAEVAYLRAENDFLVELRAKRAERNSGQKRNIS